MCTHLSLGEKHSRCVGSMTVMELSIATATSSCTDSGCCCCRCCWLAGWHSVEKWKTHFRVNKKCCAESRTNNNTNGNNKISSLEIFTDFYRPKHMNAYALIAATLQMLTKNNQ